MLGEGVKVLEGAVVGKQPTLSPRSTAKREPLPPAQLGDGTIVSTGAIVFAGTKIGARVILGDQSCVRERVAVGDDVVLGRGSLIENDTTIGAMTKIQAGAYITAYSTLEEHVFIAPCVVTSNDNFMGRTERRHELIEGPTIRRGARVGAGAVLCPAVEIGEEAFVGAGAVVTKDVPPRTLVVGNPARPLREVPEEELLALAGPLDRDRERVAVGQAVHPADRDLEVVRAGDGGDVAQALLAGDVRRAGSPGGEDLARRAGDVHGAGLPEVERRGRAGAEADPGEELVPGIEVDRVHVDRVVPVVQRRDDRPRQPEGMRRGAGVVVRLERVGGGQRAYRCRAASARARTSRTPQPVSESRPNGHDAQPVEELASAAERSSSHSTWSGVSFGSTPRSSAAAAATCGAANEVPIPSLNSDGPQLE